MTWIRTHTLLLTTTSLDEKIDPPYPHHSRPSKLIKPRPFLAVQVRTRPRQFPWSVSYHSPCLPPEALRHDDAGMLRDVGTTRTRSRHQTLQVTKCSKRGQYCQEFVKTLDCDSFIFRLFYDFCLIRTDPCISYRHLILLAQFTFLTHFSLVVFKQKCGSFVCKWTSLQGLQPPRR